MKTKKYSVMSIVMLVANVAMVIGGIFFFPSLYEDIPRGTAIMGLSP